MYDITVVVLNGSFGSGVAATLDLLNAARVMAPRVGVPAPRWRICSANGGAVRLQSGMLIDTVKLPSRSTNDRSIWVVPGIGVNNRREVHGFEARAEVQQVVAALQKHIGKGGRIAAACSAVFLLQFAGLLNGRNVTTAWWLAPILQQMNPACAVESANMLCVDENIVTAGAAFAQKDLMMHVIKTLCGPALVDLLSRYLLVDERETQAPYVLPEALANGNELVSRFVAHVENSLPEMPSVTAIANEFCMTERTLARQVKKSTGQSPLALMQTIRMRRARGLLEQSKMSVDDIAAAVGYRDATALRRMMRKVTGNTPRQYRRSSSV